MTRQFYSLYQGRPGQLGKLRGVFESVDVAKAYFTQRLGGKVMVRNSKDVPFTGWVGSVDNYYSCVVRGDRSVDYILDNYIGLRSSVTGEIDCVRSELDDSTFDREDDPEFFDRVVNALETYNGRYEDRYDYM